MIAARIAQGHAIPLIVVWLDVAQRVLDDSQLAYSGFDDMLAELCVLRTQEISEIDFAICKGQNVLIAASAVTERTGELAEKLRLAGAHDIRSIDLGSSAMDIHVMDGVGV